MGETCEESAAFYLAGALLKKRHYLPRAEQNLNNGKTPPRGRRKKKMKNKHKKFAFLLIQ